MTFRHKESIILLVSFIILVLDKNKGIGFSSSPLFKVARKSIIIYDYRNLFRGRHSFVAIDLFWNQKEEREETPTLKIPS